MHSPGVEKPKLYEFARLRLEQYPARTTVIIVRVAAAFMKI